MKKKKRFPPVLPTVLLTGFEPFGGERVNASQEIVHALAGRVVAGHRVVGVVLPCVFRSAIVALKRSIRRSAPALVIALGEAAGRSEITPERIAINVDDARIPDNSGLQPIDRPVIRGGPAAYWSTLPIKTIVAALRARQIAASVSQTAGTFVCNHTFYGLMHALRRRPGLRGGFIHVPSLAGRARRKEAGPSLATMIRGIELAIQTTTDLDAGGGQTE
jgi:pyroglutamyl-peptidase